MKPSAVTGAPGHERTRTIEELGAWAGVQCCPAPEPMLGSPGCFSCPCACQGLGGWQCRPSPGQWCGGEARPHRAGRWPPAVGPGSEHWHLLVLRRIVTPVPQCITKNHFF